MTVGTDSTPSIKRIALVYDMDACRGPTGVTRHALAQLEGLADRPEVRLSLVSGRITEPDGQTFWDLWPDLPRHLLPLRTRNMLRLWRVAPGPALEWWTGPIDWVYCPAEYFVPTRRARRAVTSHDVLQDLRLGSPRRVEHLRRTFQAADLVLSVSQFNTERLLEAFPNCRGRVAIVPNAAEDLFFEPPTQEERDLIRADLGLPTDQPYLLSVANFQERKNLPRLIRAAGKLPEVTSGELAIVLVGEGSDDQARPIREAIAALGPRAVVALPGYRQGPMLRACYAEASALVFPSTCESFGIPAVEAMAQGCPVALADSTALPEVAAEAGWYFDPENESAIINAIRSLLDDPAERLRRVQHGRTIASRFRWRDANERLLAALRGERHG